MPFARSINLNSYIRNLPISAFKMLENLLDPGDVWEQFMENIPQYLDEPNSPLRYTAQDGLNIRTKSQQKGRSPTALLLEDWSTQNPQIRHLIDVLKESDLYAAADYLSINVLRGSRVPRIGQSTFSAQCTESPGQRSFNSDSCNSCQGSFNPGSSNKCQKTMGGNPEEHSEFSQNIKREADSSGGGGSDRQPLQQQRSRKELTSINESLSGQETKSQPLLNNPPPPQPPPATEQKCEAIENDETAQMKDKFKKLDFNDGTRDRIPYNILEEMTDNFNDQDFYLGGRLLGSGGFGAVYLGVKANLKVAVKRLYDTADKETKLFETELKVLSKFQHENLVSLLGYSCGPKFCLVYTYMVNGSVEDRLACKNKTPALTVEQRVHIAKGTAQGINYLHSNNIIHRDVKSANVLLDENFLPKVGDFATARTGPDNMNSIATQVVTGTAAYLAPEAYQHDISVKLDSYSYGVVLLELLTGLPVVDYKREERDLSSHIAEHCDEVEDIYKFLDNSAGDWPEQLVADTYGIAMKCLLDRKRRRASIADIITKILSLSHVNTNSVTSSSC